MTTLTLDLAGARVHRLGVGAMRPAAEPDDARSASMELLRCAVELGVTLIDTAHLYGWGANEELIAEALHPYPEELLVPVHRIDPAIPLADQVGVLADLRDEGKIGHIGLSEVSAAQLAEARETVDIAGVQNRYNILDREHDPVVDACEQAGIALLPWRPVVAGTAGATAVIARSPASSMPPPPRSSSPGCCVVRASSPPFRAPPRSATSPKTSRRPVWKLPTISTSVSTVSRHRRSNDPNHASGCTTSVA